MCMKKRIDCEKKNSRSNATTAMALICIFTMLISLGSTYIFLELKFKEPLTITLSDWLKIILPVVGGAIVSIFAFLGVDRLKNFDERQDRLAKELRDNLDTQIDNAIKLVQPRLNESYQQWEDSLKEKLSEYDKAFDLVAERIDKYNKIMGSVEKIEEVTDAIGNVEEAHHFVSGLFSDVSARIEDKAQRTRIFVALVGRVQRGDIKGDCNDYHNLASEFASHNYFEFASDITKKGLELFGDNIDLLSDYTFYSRRAGRKNDVQDGLKRLENIEREIWNWRAFTFYIDVLNDGEATKENREQVLQCVSDYKRVLPDEERAYMAEYETYKKYGELESAENALATAEEKLAMTAQCSLVLSHIYHMRGDYDKAIESASRAIIGQADTQPSSNTGAAFAHRGFAKDAKILREVLASGGIDSQYSAILSAISDYNMAIRSGFAHNNVISRIRILQGLLPAEMRESIENTNDEDRTISKKLALAVLKKMISEETDNNTYRSTDFD